MSNRSVTLLIHTIEQFRICLNPGSSRVTDFRRSCPKTADKIGNGNNLIANRCDVWKGAKETLFEFDRITSAPWSDMRSEW